MGYHWLFHREVALSAGSFYAPGCLFRRYLRSHQGGLRKKEDVRQSWEWPGGRPTTLKRQQEVFLFRNIRTPVRAGQVNSMGYLLAYHKILNKVQQLKEYYFRINLWIFSEIFVISTLYNILNKICAIEYRQKNEITSFGKWRWYIQVCRYRCRTVLTRLCILALQEARDLDNFQHLFDRRQHFPLHTSERNSTLKTLYDVDEDLGLFSVHFLFQMKKMD